MFNLFKKNKGSATEAKQDSNVEKPQESKKEQPNYKKSIQEIEHKIPDKRIIDTIKLVKDPELGVDIWTLELIYDIEMKEKKIDIVMTFTSPLCPYGPELVNNLKNELISIGLEPNIEVVFTPFWQPSDEVKELLGLSL